MHIKQTETLNSKLCIHYRVIAATLLYLGYFSNLGKLGPNSLNYGQNTLEVYNSKFSVLNFNPKRWSWRPKIVLKGSFILDSQYILVQFGETRSQSLKSWRIHTKQTDAFNFGSNEMLLKLKKSFGETEPNEVFLKPNGWVYS